MAWESQLISGKPVTVYTPAQKRFAVLYLHDIDEPIPIDDTDFPALLERNHLSCYAPLGGQSWWSHRVCPEFDPAQTAEQFLLTLPPVQAIIGTGIGGQAAVRLSFRYPDRFPIVAAIDAAFDLHDLYGLGTTLDELYERKEQARQETAILQIVPHRVPLDIRFACSRDSRWYRGNDRLHEKLSALGIAHTFDETAFENWEPYFDWMSSAMRTNSRRLL